MSVSLLVMPYLACACYADHSLLAIPSRFEDEEEKEKATPPLIMVTPSTPTDCDAPPLYPAGRLPQHQNCWLDEEIEIDQTLKPVSRWPWRCLSTRTCRVLTIMTVLALIALLHFVVIRAVTNDDYESK